jgi:hypothetical protein
MRFPDSWVGSSASKTSTVRIDSFQARPPEYDFARRFDPKQNANDGGTISGGKMSRHPLTFPRMLFLFCRPSAPNAGSHRIQFKWLRSLKGKHGLSWDLDLLACGYRLSTGAGCSSSQRADRRTFASPGKGTN